MKRIKDYSVLFVIIRIMRYGLFIFRNEATNRTIVGSFTLGTEETAWKLLHPPMIGDALTASSFAVTGFIGTGTSILVLI
jgi:hypothetical protein